MKFKNKRTFKNRILAMMLAIAMLCTGINVTAFANEGTKPSSSTSATVYLSVSDDEVYVGNVENLEKPVVLQKLTVPYFDLALYGLEGFYYGSEATKESAEGKVTMLHAFIYATEVLYCGVDEADAGKGYLKENGILDTDTLRISGSHGSMFFNNFWNMDLNLNYYKNYEYPLAGPGWGATADQILVQDGDVISFAHFSDYAFWLDPAMGFHYLKANGQTTQAEVTKGVDKDLSLEVYRTAQGENYTTLQKKITDENALFYTSVDDLDDGRVSAWKELGITDTDGNLTVDVDSLPAGEYLIGIDGQPGANADAICSAPGAIRLTVKGPDAKDTAAAKEVTEKIDAIGEVTLESEGAIKEARTAYDALTDTQKALVTNKDMLEKAENTWKELKDAKDKADAADAAAAKEVTEKINAIGEVTLESEGAIKEARTAYDALTDTQKALVTNKDVLEKAENTWKELKDAKDKADAADAAAAKEVTEKIDAIGEVTLESEDAIKEARTAYDALTDTQKALVTNKDVLEKAENTWKELKDAKDKADAADAAAAKEVTEKINAIGDVTLKSEDAIKEARTAYDALTDAQKELVSNKDVLEKAESTLKELKDAKDADDAKVAATPKSITLSNTRYIYNGKVQKPKVTVKNAKGEVIKGYTVKYAGNCKNVGKYKVTLTFKGDYNGTKTKTFKIAPKSVKVKSLKAAKKRFNVKWSKQTTQVTGYQVQYSTDKNFVKAVKNKKITKNSVVTKTVKNLKSKKVYYVRVRTYTTVKYNGEQMNLHSDWSKVKKVTVK